jgi:hypothetical protein
MRGRIITEEPLCPGGPQEWEARPSRHCPQLQGRLCPPSAARSAAGAPKSRTDQVMALYENLAVALEGAGFRGRDVCRRSPPSTASPGRALDLAAPEVVWDPPAQGYPTLTDALAHAGPSGERGEAAFDFGLEILIAGLHSRLHVDGDGKWTWVKMWRKLVERGESAASPTPTPQPFRCPRCWAYSRAP